MRRRLGPAGRRSRREKRPERASKDASRRTGARDGQGRRREGGEDLVGVGGGGGETGWPDAGLWVRGRHVRGGGAGRGEAAATAAAAAAPGESAGAAPGRPGRASRPLRAHTAASRHQRPRRVPARRAATRPGPPSGWPSGLRRCVQVAVSPGGVGSNPTPDTPTFWPARPGHRTPAGLHHALSQARSCLTRRSCLAP